MTGAGAWASMGSGGRGGVDKEHMFDTVITPRDDGKINRLVIPKQHAEKFFFPPPEGRLLIFEDSAGKLWSFRCIYKNSCQSYFMTMSWRRFVSEKRLDAGDTVSFSRGAAGAMRDCFFIDCKHREPRLPPALYEHRLARPRQGIIDFRDTNASAPGQQNLFSSSSGPLVNSSEAAVKRVRLFGIHLDNLHQHGGGSSRSANTMSLRMRGWEKAATLSLPALPRHGPGDAESSAASSPSSSSSSKPLSHLLRS